MLSIISGAMRNVALSCRTGRNFAPRQHCVVFVGSKNFGSLDQEDCIILHAVDDGTKIYVSEK
jgi:hypothetical protein